MNTIVVFTGNNARVIRNPEDISVYETASNAVINPDLKHLVGIPPHLWKLNLDKTITAMSTEESEIRHEHISIYGTDNEVKVNTEISSVSPILIQVIRKKYSRSLVFNVIKVVIQMVVGGLIVYLIKGIR